MTEDSQVYIDVKKAIGLLHNENLVFADLRRANILRKPGGGVMLVDFDWVGEHGKDRYPATWNTRRDTVLGVDKGMLLDKAHDLLMLEKLQKS